MKLPIPAAYLKLGAAAAIVGAVAAGAISFTLPRRYVSTAVWRSTPQAVPAWQIELEVNNNLNQNLGDILSRSSLTEMIQRIGLDLYREDLASRPMEDVIQDMRSRDLRIEHQRPWDFRISFEYPDRLKAQAVVRELTARLNGPVEVLTPATLPEKPSQPDRLAIVAIGLGVGLASGILFAFLRRRGLKWTLRMAGCTVAGCALAAAICLLMPDTFVDHQKIYQFLALGAFTGLVAGAFLLRARATGGNRYARLIAFSAAFGTIAGGFVSFAIPERYVSTATMGAAWHRRGIVTAGGAAEYNERLRLTTEDILSRGYLAALIQRPALDLYRSERFRRPMEDIADDMRRRDLRIGPLGVASPGLTAFQISFEYADRDKAQAVVRELVDGYRWRFAVAEREFAKAQDGADRKPESDLISGIPQLEVLDYATLPAGPVSPNRPAVAAIGLLAGLLVGSLLTLRRWLAARQAATPGPHVPYGKYTFAAAAIGAIAFGLGSFAIPDRYVSTAVLRVVPFPGGGVRTARGEIEYTARLRQLTQDVLSRGSLTELIQRIHLYRRQRALYPMEEVIDDMRNRDIRIAPTPPFGFAGPDRLTSFEISFEYPESPGRGPRAGNEIHRRRCRGGARTPSRQDARQSEARIAGCRLGSPKPRLPQPAGGGRCRPLGWNAAGTFPGLATAASSEPPGGGVGAAPVLLEIRAPGGNPGRDIGCICVLLHSESLRVHCCPTAGQRRPTSRERRASRRRAHAGDVPAGSQPRQPRGNHSAAHAATLRAGARPPLAG